ncbi:FAD-dependent monooxygenase [Actinomycetospora cinnamomea]|uniref:2-polyprenyl-6-methoxyphenol hydroxylase-like FAD-dependent oxidoreductase n=1 Tax=Actinomycetospora cinnamomea TaxID=663609 RepID=A0A2U1FPV1_9PSEU|nr:FAD-dependent monooxygenase [Actinomycetospora cinnamomea]PVZ14223.1 2-polyprenyl-6-methoxyphenol hydroxylase-like FAD-dependent oxidoreductase [Actinomycetospora cinnamomea]
MDDVLVVGAGPVGLTAACQLARLGVSVRVVDKLDRPTTESRAVTVHARSMEMLAPLGALPRMLARGRRVDGLAMVDGATGHTRARIDFGEVPSRYAFLLDIAQPDSEAVLAERADELGIVVERGVELIALTQDDDGVEVTLRSDDGERTTRVGWVVGADGGHSTTRHLVGTHLEGGFHGQHFAMADVETETALSPDTIRMFTHPDGVGMLFPLAGARARTIFLVDAPPAGATAPTLEEIQALADARMGGQVRMRDPLWLTYFEVHHAQVPQYRHGRVLLAGDAAHIHSPAGAQGMNTGIQDAANLAWKLALVARHGADARLLDTYHDERHPVGAEVVRTTTALTNVGTAAGVGAVLRDAALFVVGHTPAVGDAAAAKTAEVTIAYRDGRLAVHHGHHRHGTARAGDHAPDPDGLRRPDGSAVTIADLLVRPGLLLLARSDDTDTVDALHRVLGDLGTVVRVVRAASADGGEQVVDDGDVIGRHYGLGDEGLALVRPDGYLGLVADAADPELLRRYLADSLGVPEPVAP